MLYNYKYNKPYVCLKAPYVTDLKKSKNLCLMHHGILGF